MRLSQLRFTLRGVMAGVAIIAIGCWAIVVVRDLFVVIRLGPLYGACTARCRPPAPFGHVRGGIWGGVVQAAIVWAVLVGYMAFLTLTQGYRPDPGVGAALAGGALGLLIIHLMSGMVVGLFVEIGSVLVTLLTPSGRKVPPIPANPPERTEPLATDGPR